MLRSWCKRSSHLCWGCLKNILGLKPGIVYKNMRMDDIVTDAEVLMVLEMSLTICARLSANQIECPRTGLFTRQRRDFLSIGSLQVSISMPLSAVSSKHFTVQATATLSCGVTDPSSHF